MRLRLSPVWCALSTACSTATAAVLRQTSGGGTSSTCSHTSGGSASSTSPEKRRRIAAVGKAGVDIRCLGWRIGRGDPHSRLCRDTSAGLSIASPTNTMNSTTARAGAFGVLSAATSSRTCRSVRHPHRRQDGGGAAGGLPGSAHQLAVQRYGRPVVAGRPFVCVDIEHHHRIRQGVAFVVRPANAHDAAVGQHHRPVA